MPSWLRRCVAVLLLCVVGTGPALAVSEADLLPVDDAFALTASAPAGSATVNVRVCGG